MAGGMLLPLREPVYRRIWSASVLSNLGQMIGAVGAAWAMTQLTTDRSMVALVQTATMLPLMLGSIPAGAIADMFDRRKVAITGLAISLVSAASLWLLSSAGLTSPVVLLTFCFLIGTGVSLFGPAWQSSVVEQVPREVMPQAIALTSISYNIARSFGPAIGGAVVAASSASAAFLTNALFYIPLIAVLLLWRRVQPPPLLPPERVDRAIVSGFRYVFHSPPIRLVMVRTVLIGTLGASISALMPLTARDLLHGGPETYGIILGSFGAGAIVGALCVSMARRHLSGEAAIRLCAVLLGLAALVVGLSPTLWATMPALSVAGAMWMLSLALLNISVQTAVPRWVTGRVLATFQASITGGMALGSWIWGHVADGYGITAALVVSGGLLILSPLVGRWLRVPAPSAPIEETAIVRDAPETALALTPRSGPIIIEIDYRVAPDQARAFYDLMLAIQRSRQRNGAYGWSLARDLVDAGVWVERFQCPTWLDYLRSRDRATDPERALQARIETYHASDEPIRVRRLLERPFGSVRWKDSAPDPGLTDVVPLA